MITRFVFVFTRFHSFNCFKIEFWSFASFLHSLDFILSPAPNLNFDHLIGFLYWLDFILVTDLRLNFDNLFRFYIHLNSFFPRLWYLILVMCFVFTFTWIRYFNRYERFFINYFFLLTWFFWFNTIKSLYWVWYIIFWYVYFIARTTYSVGSYFIIFIELFCMGGYVVSGSFLL